MPARAVSLNPSAQRGLLFGVSGERLVRCRLVGLRGNLGDEGAERGLALPDREALTASGRPVTTAQMTQGGPCTLVLTPRPWSQASLSTGRAPSRPGSCCQGPGLRVAPAPTAWVWLFQTEGGLEPTFGSEGMRPNALRPLEVTR